MDKPNTADAIIRDHERSVARLRRALHLGADALGLLTVLVAIYGLALLAIGFGQ